MSAVSRNREARTDLAILFRVMDSMGMNEGIANHISVKGHDDIMLVNSESLLWSEMTASNLLGVNPKGEVVEGEGKPHRIAVALHLGMRQARPDLFCIIHTHMTYATTLGTLEDPRLKLCHQNSAYVNDQVVYYNEYSGFIDGLDEGRELGRLLGDRNAIMLPNHGVITTGRSVAEAFELMYYLEQACKFQVLAWSTGQPMREMSAEAAKRVTEESTPEYRRESADLYFTALKRKLIKECPDVIS